MATIYSPKIKEASIFKEIAQNVVNPLEILREALSNSIDADARNIYISVNRDSDGNFFIKIIDDGKGMNIETLHKFFNLGFSEKSVGIGEKGLGTKSFYKSESLTVYTYSLVERPYIAVMEDPWAKLNKNEVPSYTVDIYDNEEMQKGTCIIIKNYAIDNLEKYYTFDTMKDYITWFTAGGSFKNLFATYTSLYGVVKNMQVAPRIYIEDNITKTKGEICGVHQFAQPQEILREDISEAIYKKSVNYCRHFGPFHRETNINGEYVSVQVYGTISGNNCRKSVCKLRQGETYKSRFGVYIAKDFIPFLKRIDLISDSNYFHYHILVNSQNFQLTADRNNLSNENEMKVKWVLEQAKSIITNLITPLANSGYFALRKREEEEYQRRCKVDGLKKSLGSIHRLDDLLLNNIPIVKRPFSEGQTVLLLSALMANENTRQYIKPLKSITAYLSHQSTDLICTNTECKEVLVEVEYKLSSLFKHGHPLETFNYVVCWEADINLNQLQTIDGTNAILMNEGGILYLKHGNNQLVEVVELKQIVNQIIKDQLKSS